MPGHPASTPPAFAPIPPADTAYQPTLRDASAEPRPHRRELLIGLASGVLAVGVGGTIWALRGSPAQPAAQPAPPTSTGTRVPTASASATASAPATRAAGQPPQPVWTFEAPGQNQPHLVAAGSTLLVVGSELTALDPATGQQQWDFRKLWPMFDYLGASPVTLGRTQVVASSGERSLTCLDLATGGTVWQAAPPPTLTVGQFLGYDDKILYVLAKQAPNGGAWADMPSGTKGDPVIAALDCVNQKTLWTLPLHLSTRDSLPLLVTASRFIYTDGQGSLVVRDIASGQQLWSAGDPGDGAMSGFPVIIGDTLFAGDPEIQNPRHRNGYVRAFDLATGAPKYQGRSWPDLENPYVEAADGQLYLWNPDRVTAVDPATGTVRWARRSDAHFISNSGFRVAGPTVFTWPLPRDSPTITAIDRADGTDRWTYRANVQASFYSLWSAAADSDRLYLALDNQVLALPAV
ncbi:PQQ-binding-like beta-propeller repeat protein [Kitasatospora sp. NPDC101155]|uniref:outer membrane protein assembly factor BamB family protein n=1 Tax=Kitasatospora sp. NPDC101155 TaxID=3364097 RepID=UPI003826FD56